MKFILKNLLILVTVTLIIFFLFTTREFYNYCKENQLKMFCTNGWNGPTTNINDLDSFKIKGLGAGIITQQSLQEAALNDSENKYNTYGHALWEIKQIDVFKITQYWLISFFLGISVTFGYNIIENKKINKILEIIIGYILPVILMPTLYYFIRSSRAFVEQNKLIEFAVIYTIIFLLMKFINKLINKNK